MVLRERLGGRVRLRLAAAARDPRQEALGDRGVLPQQLPGLRRRGQGQEAPGQEARPAEGPGGRAAAPQRPQDRPDRLIPLSASPVLFYSSQIPDVLHGQSCVRGSSGERAFAIRNVIGSLDVVSF